jgi:hypothetical protein
MLLPYTVFVVGKSEIATVDSLPVQWRNFPDIFLLQIDNNIGPRVPHVSSVR